MIKISGYEIKSCLYKGTRSRVYRGQRLQDDLKVVLKIHADDYPRQDDVVRFRREFEIGQRFNEPHIARYYALEPIHHGLAIVSEDYGAVGLVETIPKDGFPVERFIPIALQLIDGLHVIHQSGIIHKDIKPSNILIHPDTGLVKLIDFGISTHLEEESHSETDLYMQGTVAYISPEQTGRMSRKVDYRTDFYSLGVTFYELLSGQLPYDASDASEMIHCHIAKKAESLYNLKSEVPKVISDMVERLMAKSAEDRYQSAMGLKADLERCRDMLAAGKPIEPFMLGQRDLSERFQLSQKLYGRNRDLQKLLDIVSRSIHGTREVGLVIGPTGSGKSRLIGELQKTIADHRGYFISGKFDDLSRETPMGAIIQALRDLLRQVLVERDARVNLWKTVIQEALAEQLPVLVEALPELERLVGPQHAPIELPPAQSQTRFQFALKNLLYAAASNMPITLLLDDLHMADEASMKMMGMLLAEVKVSSFIWFGTYTGEEVIKDSPFGWCLASLKESEVPITTINLSPLDEQDITLLIAETLHCEPAYVRPLASLVSQKTDGNPFFVCEFLKTLSHRGLLHFNSHKQTWDWDLRKIEEMEVTPNVVNLLVNQIESMPAETRMYLSLGAVIGNSFDLWTLAHIAEKPMEEIVNALWPALEEGLLVSQGPIEIGHAAQSLSLKFSHSRVQQVAYSLIEEKDLAELHLKTGRLLMQQQNELHHEDRLFEVVSHLNKGRHLITDEKERLYLIKADIRSAKKAIASSSYTQALNNLTTAMECLPEGAWETDYETAFDLYRTRARCAWLCADHDEAEKLYVTLLFNARPKLDKAEIFNHIVGFYTNTNRLSKAVETAIEGLALFNVKLPQRPGRMQLYLEETRLRTALANRKTQELLNLPLLEDPEIIARLELLMSMGTALYQTGNMRLYSMVCHAMVRTSLDHGNAAVSAYGYVAYGVFLCCIKRDFKNGYRFGKLAIDLIRRFNDQNLRCRIFFLFGAFISHWQKPFRAGEPIFQDGYRAGMESGSVIYTGWCMFNSQALGLLMGRFLKPLEDQLHHLEHFLRQTGARFRFPLIYIARQLMRNLQGTTPSPVSLDEEGFSEETMRVAMDKRNFRTGLAWLDFARLQAAYYHGDFALAQKAAESMEEHKAALMGTPFIPEGTMFHGLALCALFDTMPRPERSRAQRKMEEILKQLKGFTNECPENFEHKYLLVRAEWMRCQGIDAAEAYDQAIDNAHEFGFTQHLALANELAGSFWMNKGREKIAGVYLSEAWLGYQRWGANRKASLLREKFSNVLGSEMPGRANPSTLTFTSEDGSLPEDTRHLDLQAITKAFLAMSGEIDYRKLVGKMLNIMIENAGAQRGFLIINSSGTPKVEARSEGDGRVVVLQGVPINTNPNLSESVVRYVLRTREPIVLADAAADSIFSKDDYLQSRRPKSLLCTPLRQKDKVIGALYLENNLMTSAFTEERVSTLNILLAQAALCLEHSRLYMETISLNDAMRKEVVERRLAEEEVRKLNIDLEKRVIERTAQLEASQKELVEKAHEAGMADIATSVLHNVGNILTSVTTSSQLIRSTMEAPTLKALQRANGLLRENMERLDDFILRDPKGKKLLQYYLELEKLFTRDHTKIAENLDGLMKKIDSIRDVIMAQQSFASSGFRAEEMLLSKVVDDAINIMDNSMTRHEVRVAREYEALPAIKIQKTKLIHIIINLLKNSKEAMLNLAAGQKKITVRIDKDELYAYISIIDTGCGIEPAIIDKIFTHGFSTKKNGHGFGLHSCANAMTEMGGLLKAYSDGPGKGATFTMQFPLRSDDY